MSFLKYQKQNPEFLNNYLKYKRYITFNSKTTVDEAYFDLRTFFRYIKLKFYSEDHINNITISEFKQITIDDISLKDISRIGSNTIIEFIYFLRYTLNNNAKTRNKKLASIKRFFEYLNINNLISHNPAQNLECAKIEKRQPKHLNLNDSKKLLSTVINSDMRYNIRNYAITCLFLNCGLRLSELVQIDITDIKLDEKTLKVHGKGNKERIIYLNEACCEAIIKYLEVRPNLGKDKIDYNALFISSRNKRISNRTVQTIIKEELSMAFDNNINGLHTHTLRHSNASLLYNLNNVNIFILKKILGHSSIAATEIYTHIDPKKLKNIMETCTISSILENMKEEISNGRNY